MAEQRRTPEQRKKEARQLIKTYHAKRHDNVTHKLATTLEFARWEVKLDGRTVHFQDDGNRVWYLGEYEPRPDPTQAEVDEVIFKFNQSAIWRL